MTVVSIFKRFAKTSAIMEKEEEGVYYDGTSVQITKDQFLGAVTSIKIIPDVGNSRSIILAAIGPSLHAYSLEESILLSSYFAFDGGMIHGLSVKEKTEDKSNLTKSIHID